MRKVIFGINMSLDGCCDHTKLMADVDAHKYFMDLMRDVDLLVFGRKTYELMVPYWPDIAKTRTGDKSDIEFAEVFDSKKLLVFSRSLKKAEGKTRIVSTKPQDEIAKLKQEQGKNILVGGVDLSSQLMESGLVDEYHFVIQPILAGDGRRLLEGVHLAERFQLKLAESKIFKSGCVALRYLKQ